MANLVLNQECNRHCSFCFAPHDRARAMPRSEVEELIDALASDGKDTVPLVGGEPTLHPEFVAVVDLIASRGMKLRLFTNADMSARVLERLMALPPERCSVIVNASASLTPSGHVASHVVRRIAALGPRASLGVTLSGEPYPDLGLVELYALYPLARRFRLGVAQPTLDGDNASVDYRRPGLGSYITELGLRLAAEGVTTHFDCGLVLCTFSASELAALDSAGVNVRSACRTIPDVASGGEASPCYPLSSRYRKRREARHRLPLLRDTFEKQLSAFRRVGLYPECPSCHFFRSGRCMGGCLARVIGTFSPLGQSA